MKLLLLDVETSPNTAFVWSLWKENIPLARLIETSKVLCWSAKLYGEKKVMFDSTFHSSPNKMLFGIHDLLNEADAVVHYNGQNFDIPVLQREFLLYGIRPPAPYKQIDLLQVVRKQFRFVSNKMAHVSKSLGIEGKANDMDFTMWINCMANDPAAWKQMKAYNINDVLVLEKLYDKLMPWIRSHPNFGLYRNGEEVCPHCGGNHLQRRGYAFTNALKYIRLQCQGCGNWLRSKSPVDVDKKAKVTNIL